MRTTPLSRTDACSVSAEKLSRSSTSKKTRRLGTSTCSSFLITCTWSWPVPQQCERKRCHLRPSARHGMANGELVPVVRSRCASFLRLWRWRMSTKAQSAATKQSETTAAYIVVQKSLVWTV